MGFLSKLRPDPTCGHGRPIVNGKVRCRICSGEKSAMTGTYRNGRKVSEHAVNRRPR